MSHEHSFQPPRNGLGNAALVLGLVAAGFTFVPLVGVFVAGPSAPLALVFGLTGLLRAEEGRATNKGAAVTGGLLGLASTIVLVVILAATIGPVDAVNPS